MLSLLAFTLATTPAHACGGFFCSSGGATTTTTQTSSYGAVPVVQDAERILFRVNADGTLTTFVEVAFEQREDTPDFAWIIPIPDVIDVDQVTTADASMFNALELATAPAFSFTWQQQTTVPGYYGTFNEGMACSAMGCAASGESSYRDTAGFTTTETVAETASVEVLQDAVVGPFAIEVISATDALDFATWLDANGYDLPDGAVGPLEHYIDRGMSFLGVKLAPDVPTGPVDTLVFTCPAEAPAIPLILTSIASADALSVIAYVLADVPYVPSNWGLARDFAPETRPLGGGETDYLARAEAELSVFDGRGWVLEYAGPTESLAFDDLIVNATVKQYPRLVRYRGRIAPWQMTVDPEFAPFPGFPDYAREHTIDLGLWDGPTARRAPLRGAGRRAVRRRFRGQGAWLLFAPLALLGWARRRSGQAGRS